MMRKTLVLLAHGRSAWRGAIRGAALAAMLCGLATLPTSAGPRHPGKPLQIYFVDVEGGQSTLFVTPQGQSLLIDTGWPGNDGRDADRILAAARLAQIRRLDFVILTHYHQDHAGGIPQLAARIPIGTVLDHGANRETGAGITEKVFQDYQAVLADGKVKRVIARPGDIVPIQGIRVVVVSADGELLSKALPGAGKENPACAASGPYPADQTENPRSLGTLLTFGKMRVLDLGDLTSDKEMLLMCPANKLGTVDLLVVSHHGTGSSSSPALVHAVAPRVAIMDNGPRKGGAPSVFETIEKSPGLEDLWQLHTAEQNDAAHNVADAFIANLAGPDAGNYLKVTAWSDGSFEVFNSRTQTTKTYAAR